MRIPVFRPVWGETRPRSVFQTQLHPQPLAHLHAGRMLYTRHNLKKKKKNIDYVFAGGEIRTLTGLRNRGLTIRLLFFCCGSIFVCVFYRV
jgi:hypothetical protein